MKGLPLLLLLLLLGSCSKNYTPVREYVALPVKYPKEKISHPSNDFSMTIPQNWFWKSERYESEKMMLGITAAFSETTRGYTQIISVYKYRSLQKNATLYKEYESSRKYHEDKATLEMVESGKTKLNNYDAYFMHLQSTNENPIEIITFLVKGKEQGVFYSITANGQLKDEPKTNMAIMVKCLNSFEYN
ncbi:hypothetical protein [Flavobacterium sp.]|uniref:hypothetical protein n=1 Tax=Flavobacterium sp. TaxID=239 RepID=UPI0039E30C63